MEQPRTTPGTGHDDDPRSLVVAAAVLRTGRVLAARRATPAALAGRWELPGGKVRPGEDPATALVREIDEELGCTVRVTGWLPGRSPVAGTLELAVATAVLLDGEPVAGEHDRLRWLSAAELGTVDWLEPDRPFLPGLAIALGDLAGGPSTGAAVARAVFAEREAADAVAEALRTAGHRAEVVRERLAGEDDDEDHPWAVLTAVVATALAPLVEQHDGWIDADTGSTRAPRRPLARAPLPPLPRAPRRRHREPGA